ncbi:MAG: GNAT family N-acetyltransferase [Eubacteriales bacterium]|nr:GNAT family N-acetyltransferase [Eubacteriales bacterium]
MKNNKTFIKKWELKQDGAQVWLTDSAQKAEALAKDGACVVYLITPENKNDFCGGVEWCAETPQDKNADEDRDGSAAVLPEGAPGWKAQLAAAEETGLPDWLPEEFLRRVWRRSRNLPWHICETPRLVLREMTEADLDFLYEMQRDEEAARFLGGLSHDWETERQKLAAYRHNVYGFYGFGIWLVVEKESGRPVGMAGLQMRDGFETPELGFAIASPYRRKGYAQEACRAVLQYAKEELELDRVRAVVDQDNFKSRRLCEKLGFTVDNVAETDGRMCIFYEMEISEAGHED